MKKTFVKVLITILINALFTLGAVCICQFNTYVNEYFSNYGNEIIGVASIVLMGLGSICGIIISKAVTKKDIKNLEVEVNVKKYRIITVVYNLILYLVCATYVWLNEDYYLTYFFDIGHIILLLVLMSISSLLCFTLYKYREKKKIYEVVEMILNILSVFFIIFSMLCSLYLILPINEFKYNYAILSTEEMKEWGIENVFPGDEHVVIYDYNRDGIFQDRRKHKKVNSDLIIPDKLQNKPVELVLATIYCNSNVNIKIPSSISFDALKLFDVYYYKNFDWKQASEDGADNTGKIILKDNNADYSIENNIATKNDGTDMIFLCIQKYDIDNFIISEKLQNITSPWSFYNRYLDAYLKDSTKITLDENNPYYIISGDCLYSSTHSIYFHKDFSEEAQKENYCIVSPLKKNSNIILDDSLVGDKKVTTTYVYPHGNIIISDNYSNLNFDEINIIPNSYIVSSKNQYFSGYSGNLYTKDFSKLLRLTSADISTEIGDISEECYSQIQDLIDDDEIDFYVYQKDLVLDNKILYSMKHKKIIATGSCDEITIIDGIEDISENVMNWLYSDDDAKNVTMNVSGDNKYFEEENGFIFKNGKEKLIFGPNLKKHLFITKETKEIDERLLARFSNYFVEVDPANKYFEMHEGNLYTKGREKLLAICNSYEEAAGEFSIKKQDFESGEN